MEQAIKAYLEDAIKTDPTLCATYNAKKIGECVKYITEQAKKYLNGKNGAVADEIVYKWARDFFIDGETERQDNVTEEAEVKEAVEAQQAAPEQPVKKRLGELEQLDLFGSLV